MNLEATKKVEETVNDLIRQSLPVAVKVFQEGDPELTQVLLILISLRQKKTVLKN